MEYYAKIIVVDPFKIDGGIFMSNVYKLTVFESNGEKLLDESFTAENNKLAKEIGHKMLAEKNFLEKTHRCTSPQGSLVLFHS